MNIGNCDNANTGEIFEIAEGEELKCPKCHQDMIVEVTKKPWGKIIGIIVAVLAVIGCCVGAFFAFSGGEPDVTGITLDKNEITLKVGQSDVIKATPVPADAKATFTFNLSDGSSVKVGSGGDITAVEEGSSTITVKCEENPDLRAICTVKVEKEDAVEEPGEKEPEFIAVESITIEGDFTLKEGESKKLTVAIAPQNHEEAIACQSSDEAVATVSQEGEVKALKAGKATITLVSDKTGKQATVNVTVQKKSGGGGDGTGTTPTPEKNPSWGKYTGQRNAQGLPHGNGVLRITRSTTINGETAQPGERIEGVFRNGYVNMGSWYKNDGNVVVVKDLKAY